MITFLAVLAGFVLPLAIHSPEYESLHDAGRPDIATKLRFRAGTLSLGVLLIAVAAATFGSTQFSIDPRLGTIFALSRQGVFERGWVFEFLTSNFIHINLFHLVSNLFVLMLLSAYEWRVGIHRYIAVFLLAAVASSMIDLLLMLLMRDDSVSMGASAGIFGLASAYFLDYRDVSRKDWIVGISAVLVLVGFYSFLGNVNEDKIGGTVNWTAHMSGALVGGVYVRVFDRE